MLYVGVDAHQESTQVTVMDEAGRVVKRQRVRSSVEGIREPFDLLAAAVGPLAREQRDAHGAPHPV